ncbi:TadA family conjugal transfer-associated ATPase [Ornithinimicrobium humiphilum]|uniref:Pilus assembly protein CpaF n=2 Tax=Ornithinimicrobium humiphilum TaxID=125288 RepID=A0A543KKB3_9MICO|nr:TadA family conjugal transfer-associated ATPase [Ornithinimicrobium humiphilum]TQM95517.1 pilus assembly protein CpaF [Ornithinimicrobium humiphilum]
MSDVDERAEVAAALGPLAAHLSDGRVTDILVNGAAGVWVDRGGGVEPVESPLRDERTVRRLAVRLAGLAGQRLDDASPWVDGLLPGGIRLHAVLPPLVAGGAHVSLRVPRRAGPTLEDLRAWGALDAVALRVLEAVVAAKVSFVVSGGTGSGKTTVLAAMLARVPASERIAVVEDVRELRVDHPHVVHLQGRSNNVEGRGEVTLPTLVRQSLRMRPDRLVVGEVRGAEVRELLTALNTGHEGGCGTVHANAAADVVSRMEALGALAGLGPAAVHAQLASAIEVVLHVVRGRDGARRLAEVAVLEPVTGVVRSVPALLGAPGAWTAGPAWPRLARRAGLPDEPEGVWPGPGDEPEQVGHRPSPGNGQGRVPAQIPAQIPAHVPVIDAGGEVHVGASR